MKDYMSPSQFKEFMGCEAYALAKCKGELEPTPDTKEQIIGKLVEAILEGRGDDIIEEYRDEIMKGKNKDEMKVDYVRAIETVVPRVQQDKMFMEYLEGEKQVELEFEWLDTKWKCRPDVVNFEKQRIVDLKTTKDFKRTWKDGEFKSFGEAWGYDIQLAVYQKGIELFTDGEIFRCFINAVTKEAIPNFDILEVEQIDIEECQERVARHIPRILALKAGEVEPIRCECCDYCKQTKVLTKPLPYKLAGMDPSYLD